MLPETEQKLFLQCARNGNTSQSVAKCLVQLFEARDRAIRRKNDPNYVQHKDDTSQNTEQGIVPTTIQFLKQMFIDPLSSLKKTISTNFEAPKETKTEKHRKRNLKKLELSFRQFQRKMVRRKRREIVKRKTYYAKLAKHQKKTLSNLEKIDRIRNFQEKYVRYTENISKYNEMRKSITETYQLKTAKIGRQNRTKKHINDGRKLPDTKLTKTNQPKNVSRFFSPRIFSFVSTPKKILNSQNANDTISFMSPELLRLYEDEDDDKKFVDKINGTFNSINLNNQTVQELLSSVPNLLRLLTPDKTKRRKFLENILISLNVGQVLDQILEPITLITDTLDKGLFNTSKILRESMEVLVQLKDTMTRDQHKYYLDNGYTFLSGKQMEILRTGKVPRGIKRDVLSTLGGSKFKVTAEQMEDEIERYIYERAASPMGEENVPFKTETNIDGGATNVPKFRQKRNNLPIQGPVVGILSPFAFVPQVGSWQLFTLYVLSPQAFIPSYSNPAAFYMQLLTPWAFLANLFSPQFITCMCISPTAFEANLLSAQAIFLEILSPATFQANLLTPYMLDLLILSPQALVADLLSPQLIQPKILSPQSFSAGLLSPPIGSPSYFSDESYTFMVLSPEVYSPNVASKLSNSIFILSPEIGGGHDESEFETEGENVFIWPKTDEPEEEAYLGENSAHPDTSAHIHPNILHPDGS
ncbi:hypothetical protein niasHT_039160 [Heterodera trifolii]|uniref:Uncharacterized protein n=1 Tax=Heterodera trifolii TaxID=157864 RepID=A0ABD2IJX8_9BILA